ncbi:hypothetical protein, partial [Nocardioides sp. P5_C9_2]
GSPGAARAWGWVAHLRDGGTTPWSAWAGEAPASGRVLPGAQQLELLRRLNVAGGVAPSVAHRVLTAAAPGRGKPDLALAGVPRSEYGPRPVDPGTLPADELVRVATSVLAEDVVRLGVPRGARGLPRPWARPHRVAGDPVMAVAARQALGPRHLGRGRMVVIGAPLDQMLADVWTRRCFERGSFAWSEWLRFWRQRDQLPPRIDLPAVAERHRGSPGGVVVVLERTALPQALGVRHLPPLRRPGADAAELGRRIATVVGVLVSTDERAALMSRTLWPRIPLTTMPPVSVPDEHREWVTRAAEGMTRGLRRAGYPVVGDPAAVAPVLTGETPAAERPDVAVLELAVRMLVDDDWTKEAR